MEFASIVIFSILLGQGSTLVRFCPDWYTRWYISKGNGDIVLGGVQIRIAGQLKNSRNMIFFGNDEDEVIPWLESDTMNWLDIETKHPIGYPPTGLYFYAYTPWGPYKFDKFTLECIKTGHLFTVSFNETFPKNTSYDVPHPKFYKWTEVDMITKPVTWSVVFRVGDGEHDGSDGQVFVQIESKDGLKSENWDIPSEKGDLTPKAVWTYLVRSTYKEKPWRVEVCAGGYGTEGNTDSDKSFRFTKLMLWNHVDYVVTEFRNNEFLYNETDCITLSEWQPPPENTAEEKGMGIPTLAAIILAPMLLVGLGIMLMKKDWKRFEERKRHGEEGSFAKMVQGE